MSNQPVAVVCSDIHFSDRAPVSRDAEDSWFGAMSRAWYDMKKIADEVSVKTVIIAGDIFDHWKPSPSLINLAMGLFEGLEIYAIPGQHDLPEHRFDDRERSGYGVLENLPNFTTLVPNRMYGIPGHSLNLCGFPWGFEIEPYGGDIPAVAIIHKYIWKQGYGYLDAPQEAFLGEYKKCLRGYRSAVFGDNHKGFFAKSSSPELPDVFNCGGFMPRKSDEKDQTPTVGILYSDGSIVVRKLPTEQNVWSLVKETEALKNNVDSAEFLEKLSFLSIDSLDFRHVVLRFIEDNKVEPSVKERIILALG